MICGGIEIFNAVAITAFCIGQLGFLFIYNINMVFRVVMAYGPTTLRIFLGVVNNEEIGHKSKRLLVLSSLFRLFDWGMIAVGFLVTTLAKEIGRFPNWSIFLLLWTGYVLQSRFEIFANDRFLNDDITLMKGLRRLVDALMAESRFWGFVGETVVFIRISVWDGVGCMAIYYRPFLPASRFLKTILLILAAGLHIAIWFTIYIKGYDGIYPLLRDIYHFAMSHLD